MKSDIIYLDHTASTPMDNRVFLAMQPYLTEKFYNPSSPYLPATMVRQDYEDAKKNIARLIGAKSGDIVVTAGATESINLALFGVSGHIISSNVEHQAILKCVENRNNTIVLADNNGYVSPEKIANAIKPETELISIQLANGELGTMQPIRDIAAVVKNERQKRLIDGNKNPIYFHCDASLGVGLVDINIARLGVDMLTLNSGKIYGPKQVGLLWISSEAKLVPQILGGGQEGGYRSGTENVAGTIGFALALEIAQDHRRFEFDRLLELRDFFQSELTNAFPDAVVSGDVKNRLPNYLHISFPGLDAERLIFLLEDKGVLVASSSACSANKGVRSHILSAIGVDARVANASLRITLGRLSNEDNIKRAAKIIIDVVTKEFERVGQ